MEWLLVSEQECPFSPISSVCFLVIICINNSNRKRTSKLQSAYIIFYKGNMFKIECYSKRAFSLVWTKISPVVGNICCQLFRDGVYLSSCMSEVLIPRLPKFPELRFMVLNTPIKEKMEKILVNKKSWNFELQNL